MNCNGYKTNLLMPI